MFDDVIFVELSDDLWVCELVVVIDGGVVG